ncbi:RNA polymerase sigma factor [Brevibacillus ginsengisoli]|uniref:RNA polymerase sigma factor n=1 Tax=Brevibacillus ginsengisoli TaxID=363854 RepID=UPI003CEC9093
MTRESELMKECRLGNKEAFYELVEPHLAKAYRTSYAILHCQSEAEDAVQNALLEVYQSLLSTREIQHFGGWFHKLVVYRSLDLYRKKAKESERTTTAELLPMVSAIEPTPMDRLIDSEEYDQLLVHLLKLSIQHRTVIVLYYFQEYNLEEIARLLNLKLGTVKSRLYHARIQLSQFYKSNTREGIQ